MFGDDYIAINETKTFRKSEIQGYLSEFSRRSKDYQYFILYFLVNGEKFEVDREPVAEKWYTKEYDSPFSHQEKIIPDENVKLGLKEYHRKWTDRLQTQKEEKERKII